MRTSPLGKASDVEVVVAIGVVVEVTIGDSFLAGELPRVIICPYLISDSAEDVVLILDKGVLAVVG